MKKGALISVVAGLFAAIGLGFVFVMNSSPYAKISEASKMNSEGIHVVGSIDMSTLKAEPGSKQMTFLFKDETGMMPVIYNGPPKSNLQNATQVVVIGGMKNGTFHARDMLVKCPSKYESEQGDTPKKFGA